MNLKLEDAENTMKWLGREIDWTVNHLPKMQRYVKARNEGYLNALKKVQARLDGKIK